MKVKDIISNSQWFPPRNFTGDTIPITVMIPNYNRGSSGLFEAAILSILSQTFKEFNLILIEDGSDDNSMEIVRKYMALDERVGCIYHPLNVGIPAISVYEAYIKTKSEYICLAQRAKWLSSVNQYRGTFMRFPNSIQSAYPLRPRVKITAVAPTISSGLPFHEA
ncbi:Glycosyl transferase, family 2 [Pararhodospirillum photometricum DSM 122]|uniref:Glycosyl transferase, family 2 n=1 Tax=Pararhodospirillum photometricum DSM 122 TaxID=1150469 RepID=H6SID4_PARPM|nr:Glycosyl transferase, family 2 [Pararhodospirillum photometricum DSM 122]